MTKRNKRAARFPLPHPVTGRPLTTRQLPLDTNILMDLVACWRNGRWVSRRTVTFNGVTHPLRGVR